MLTAKASNSTAFKKPDGIRGAKLTASPEGDSFIITYDKITSNPNDTYEGFNYSGEKMEVFDDGSKALERLIEIVSMDNYVEGRDIDIVKGG